MEDFFITHSNDDPRRSDSQSRKPPPPGSTCSSQNELQLLEDPLKFQLQLEQHWLWNCGVGVITSCWRRHLPRVEITLPRETRDLLMLAPSFSLVPEVDATSARSLPARSTRWILLKVLWGSAASNHACNIQQCWDSFRSKYATTKRSKCHFII